jgi:hypothetical protein
MILGFLVRFLTKRISQKVQKERPNLTIKIYKGYEIDAMAEQDDNAEWSVSVCIYAHKRSHSSGRIFKSSEKHINQKEAIMHGLVFGQRIVDGVVEDCSIEDL